MAVFHLATMSEVARVGKRRGDRTIAVQRCVPAAMVEVKVSVNDDVDLVWANAGGCQGSGQKLLIAMDLAHLCRLLVADSGLDQDGLFSCSDNDSIKAKQD